MSYAFAEMPFILPSRDFVALYGPAIQNAAHYDKITLPETGSPYRGTETDLIERAYKDNKDVQARVRHLVSVHRRLRDVSGLTAICLVAPNFSQFSKVHSLYCRLTASTPLEVEVRRLLWDLTQFLNGGVTEAILAADIGPSFAPQLYHLLRDTHFDALVFAARVTVMDDGVLSNLCVRFIQLHW